jgi:uncharacterized protein (TIGR00251 family)
LHAFLTSAPGGVRLKIRLAPRASRNGITGLRAGALKISLTAAPVDGAANAALVGFLSKFFRIRKGAVTITSGLASRDKRVFVEGVTVEEAAAALSGFLGE